MNDIVINIILVINVVIIIIIFMSIRISFKITICKRTSDELSERGLTVQTIKVGIAVH